MMKRLLRRSLGLILFFLMFSVAAVAQDWPEQRIESRPGTRWWWLGSAVDSANLAYNIAEYARAGLGTLEITPIYGVRNNEKNDILYLSSDWMRMLRATYDAGSRNGVKIEMNNGTGWPFGGPEVTEADAAKKCVLKADSVTGRLAIAVEPTRQKVKRAAPGGEGYVIDHLDSAVVKRYLAKFDSAFQKTGTPYPAAFFNDSYEVYGADWTPSFLAEFKRRRGYCLEEHLEEFAAKERGEATRRIVSDYRQTMSELLLDNFLRVWTGWAHSHGSLTRNQAHGSPANLIDAYACVDIPECEGFGLSDFGIKGLRVDSIRKKNDSDISMLKYASSAANVTGKRLVSSETFTWLTDHFRTSLSQCKPDMDLMFLAGVNHMFFHGTPYSPQEARWPGWLFYASINMSPTNTIWRDAPAFFRYITRCQSFLQYWQPDNDFLLYLPIYDIWDELPGRMVAFDIHKMNRYAPKFIKTVHSILDEGYNVDYISDAFLGSSTGNGKIRTEGGAEYEALIVPYVRLMPDGTLAAILRLANEGATVAFVGGLPEDVPGFNRLETRRKIMRRLKSRIGGMPVSNYGKGKIIVTDDYQQAFSLIGTKREDMKKTVGLSYIRRKSDNGGHLYFISNLQPCDIDTVISISKPGNAAMFFNPMDGGRGEIPLMEKGGEKAVRLQLKSGESVFLQTFGALSADMPKWRYVEELPGAFAIEDGWVLTFPESEPPIPGAFNIGAPASWTSLPVEDASVNSGTGRYAAEFELPDTDCDDWILDLGDVRESAVVRVNGKEVATLWAVPFRAGIGKWLQPGKNTLEVDVTNLPANRIAEMDRQGREWRIFKDANIACLGGYKGDFSGWDAVPSGLNSEVRLIPVRLTEY